MIILDIDQAAATLSKNELVAIPTETVYGLAANAYNAAAVQKIFDLKRRPSYNPLIVHVKGVEALSEIASDIPEIALKLAQTYWPGPLTLVLKKKSIVPDIVTAGKDTVAIRVPNHPVTLSLLHKIKFPVAAPSANPFGSISPTTAQHVEDFFGEQLTILEGGACQKGLESTIIGFDQDRPIIYRLGSLSIEEIESVIGALGVKNKNDQAPIAPGMLSKHYAPKTTTIKSDNLASDLEQNKGKKVGLIVFQNPPATSQTLSVEILSESGDLNEAAKNLYAAMHRLDQLQLDIIIAETFPDKGLGKTINDKLTRASKN